MRLSFCTNLHAKCYLSETSALVTSMNLYEFSQVNNHEMGISLTKAEDPALRRGVRARANRLLFRRVAAIIRHMSATPLVSPAHLEAVLAPA